MKRGARYKGERLGGINGVLKGLFFAFSRLGRIRALAILAPLTLGSCMQATSDVTSADHPNASDTVRSIDLQPRYPKATENVNPSRGGDAPASYFGTPTEAVVRDPPPTSDVAGGFALNFENTSVATVAKVVLGDILSVGYVIDPRAQGTISLSSGRPIAKKDMLFVLENALRVEQPGFAP